MPALPTIYKRNQGQTTRSLTAVCLAIILGSLCYWVHGQLLNYVPLDQASELNVHNAKGWKLERDWPNKKEPVYKEGTVVTDAMINEFDNKSVKMLFFRPANPIPYALYLQFGVPTLLFLVGAYFIFMAVNKERFADFLIATESEMKKVAWSSKAELMGSTAVVIITVILLAIVIWLSDVSVIEGLKALKVY